MTLLPPGSTAPAGVEPLGHGFCRNTAASGAFGAHITVVCSTGVVVDLEPGAQAAANGRPMHGGAFRFVTQAVWNGEWVDALDAPYGSGTFSSWRVLRLTDRNVLELTVGW